MYYARQAFSYAVRKSNARRLTERWTATTLKMAMTAMADSQSVAADVAKRLGITTTTLYAYVNGDGSLKEAGQALFKQ